MITMEAGWVVSEVGRQPWIVYNLMKVEDAATGNTGVWITFVAVVALYVGLGVTTILVLRGMSRRFRARRRVRRDATSPYGPVERDRRARGRPGRMSTAAAVVLFVGVIAYAIFGGADFGAGFWDLIAGGTERGERPREVIDHSIGPVWEANHVWLIFCFVVLWTCFPEAYASITLTLFVPLTIGRLRHRAAGRELRLPQGGVPHPRSPQLRRRLRRLVGARAVLHGRGRRGDRVGSGPRRRPGRRPVVQLGQPDLDPRRRARRRGRAVPRGRLSGLGRRRLADDRHGRRTSASGPIAAVVAGAVAFVGIFVLHADAEYLFDGLKSRALPLVILSAICGAGLARPAAADEPNGRPPARGRRRRVRRDRLGRGPVGLHAPRVADRGPGRRPDGTITAVLVAIGLAVVFIFPAFGLLYVLDQRRSCPRKAFLNHG